MVMMLTIFGKIVLRSQYVGTLFVLDIEKDAPYSTKTMVYVEG